MVKEKGYQKRFYRAWALCSDLISQKIIEKETDILVLSSNKILKQDLTDLIKKYRLQIEEYCKKKKDFLKSLVPVGVDEDAPFIIKRMSDCSFIANVGPMAAVAGAVAQCIGEDLAKTNEEIIIENGGDVFIKTKRDRIIGIYAGENNRFNDLGITIKKDMTPLGICTSSGIVGHSLSFGRADAATVLAKSATLADALATSIGNMVKTKLDSKNALEFVKGIEGVEGAIIIVDDTISSWGNVELAKIKKN